MMQNADHGQAALPAPFSADARFTHAVLDRAMRWQNTQPELARLIWGVIGGAQTSAQHWATKIFDIAHCALAAHPDLALQLFDLLDSHHYESARLHLFRADALCRCGEIDDALAAVNRSLKLDPDDAIAHNYLGHVWALHLNWQAAIDSFRRAIQLASNFAEAYGNLGSCLQRLKRYAAAKQAYQHALTLHPNHAEFQTNLALLLLACGDYERGFALYENRWRTAELAPCWPVTARPQWNGQDPLGGKTVLVWAEQGLGDTLQFCRYLPLLAQRGARVVLQAPAGLLRLFQNNRLGCAEIIDQAHPLPQHDFHIPIMSLPWAFATTLQTIPTPLPYLRASPQAAIQWPDLLGSSSHLRVGVVWAGRRFPRPNKPRDIPLAVLEPLFALNAHFACLQVDIPEREALRLQSMQNVQLWGDRLRDLQDTADLLEHLDLLVTVDSAVAHLGAAMGKEVWILNRYAPCWRWSHEGTDSFWYPGVTLFNQSSPGDWHTVVERVTLHLAKRIEHHPG